MGVGLDVAVCQAVAHDEGHRSIVHDMRSCINGTVHIARRIGRSQDASSLDSLEIFLEVHLISPFVICVMLQVVTLNP